jgi:hypothetical protein
LIKAALKIGFYATIQYGRVFASSAKSQEAPEKNRERTKRVFRHLDETLLNGYGFISTLEATLHGV